MKYILPLIMILLCSKAFSADNSNNQDLDLFPFVQSIQYDKETNFAESLISKTMVFGLNLINYDIEKLLKKKIDGAFNPYQRYFPPGKIPKDLHENVIKKGIAKYLGDKITEVGLSNLLKYVGSNLMTSYLNTLFDTLGYVNQERNKLWIEKLIAPFEKCVATSENFQFQTTHCMEAFIQNSAQNIPAFILYEGARNATGILSMSMAERVDFSLSQVEAFHKCSLEHRNDNFNCLNNTFTLFGLDIYQRKLNEILVFFAVSDERKDRLFATPWKTAKQCIFQIGTTPNPSAKSVQCLEPLISSLKNEIGADLIEKKLSHDNLFSPEEKSKVSTESLAAFIECNNRLQNFLIRSDGFSFWESNFEIMKKCEKSLFSTP